jgi:hypothetical protein
LTAALCHLPLDCCFAAALSGALSRDQVVAAL